MWLVAFLLVILYVCPSNAQALLLHADVDFTTVEREEIQQATRELMSQAHVQVDVIYDLDFGKIEQLARLAYLPRLVRIGSTAQLTHDLDARYHGFVYGWTTYDPVTQIYVIWDRLGDRQLAVHVFMHEFLHGLCARHVDDPNAVLYSWTDMNHRALRMSPADLSELARCTLQRTY